MRSDKNTRRLLAASLALSSPIAMLGYSVPTLAQAGQIEEVIVTAQKRTESLQDTPIAISAFTSQALQQKGISNIADLSNFAPNVKIAPMPSNTTGASIAIRGSVTINPTVTWEPAVGLYLDGVYVAKALGSIFDVADLERIEVLRGPQGTLYGKNTLGGAVNLITKKPSGQFGGKLSVGTGNYNLRKAYLSIDTPSLATPGGGALMAKFTVSRKQRDGFYDNVPATLGGLYGGAFAPQPPGSNDLNSLDSKIGRADVLWNATDRLTLRYAYNNIDLNNNPSKAQLTSFSPNEGPFAGALVGSGLEKYVTDKDDNLSKISNSDMHYEISRSQSHSVWATYDLGDTGVLGDVQLKYIGNIRKLRWNDSIGDDGTPFQLFSSKRYIDYKQYSHELQMIGTTAHTNYVFGLYYFNEKADILNPIHALGIFGLSPIDNSYGMDNDSEAAYGQIEWRPPADFLRDRLSITAGVRWSREVKSGYINHPGSYSADESKTFISTTPTLILAWDFTNDINAYVKYSRGWKSGGFNGESPFESDFVKGYDPATVDAFEAGIKSRLLDNRVQLNVAAFYKTINDMQLSVFLGDASASSVVRNAGEATIKGFEAELIAQVTDKLQISANYGYLKPRYNEFKVPNPGGSGEIDIKDQAAFPYASRYTVNLGADYTFVAKQWGKVIGHLDYSYIDDYVPYPLPQQITTSHIDGYGLLNGRLTLTDIPVGDNQSLELALWGKNLTDKDYRMNTIPFVTWTVSYYGDPRTYGLDVIYKF